MEPLLHAGFLIRGIPSGILENAITLAQLIRRVFPDIDIRDVKRHRKSLLFIRTTQPQDQFRLRNIPDWRTVHEFRNVEFESELATKPNPTTPRKFKPENTMVVIKGVHPSITTDQIRQEMNKEEKTIEYLTRLRSAARGTPIYKVKALYANTQQALLAIQQGATIGFRTYRCEWYRAPPQPPHCSQCLHWGHTQDVCPAPSRCYKCGDEGHQKKECPARNIRCLHCQEPHSSAYRGCTKYKEYLRSQQQQQQQNPPTTAPEALMEPMDIPTSPIPTSASQLVTVPVQTKDVAINTEPLEEPTVQEITVHSTTTQVSSDMSTIEMDSETDAREKRQVTMCLNKLLRTILRELPTYLQEEMEDFLFDQASTMFQIPLPKPKDQTETRIKTKTATLTTSLPLLTSTPTTALIQPRHEEISEAACTAAAIYTRPDPRTAAARTTKTTETPTPAPASAVDPITWEQFSSTSASEIDLVTWDQISPTSAAAPVEHITWDQLTGLTPVKTATTSRRRRKKSKK